MQRRRPRPAAVLVAVLLVAACSDDDGAARETDREGERTTIGVLLEPGAGGGADTTAALERAESELAVEVEVVESTADGSDRAELLALLAGDADVVIAIGGAAQGAVEDVAGDHPELPFAVIGGTEPTEPNVTSVQVRSEQAAYLAGAAAALSSPGKHLGFVGGSPDEVTRALEAGFTAGALRIDAATKVEVAYLPAGAATDVAAATAVAATQLEGGAEVILGAPTGVDDAVFAAAAQRVPPARAIGVGADRSAVIDPALDAVVLTWAVTHTGVVVRDVIDAFVEGRLEGGVRTLGVADGAVGITTEGLPPELVAQVDDLTERLAAREIQVPTTP